METLPLISYLPIFIMAFMYSSVGHGGASGYLAVLAMLGVSQIVMKPSALLLNIFVSGISFFQYYRSNHFNFRLFWPFAITSVPAAFLGALIPLQDSYYKKILGICLILSVLRLTLFGWKNEASTENNELKLWVGLITGALIGLVSGMIGIGGGIILSPIILLLHWGKMKETASVSALFIFVNSISGLIAVLASGTHIPDSVYPYLGFAIIGGVAGSYFGSKKFEFKILKYLLAIVLTIAALKLLLT